ncbi:dihydrolipoamide dehydrogenase [bacterium]|nr:MAG: dihydrolipoamide dehydrogenase [bacterium]
MNVGCIPTKALVRVAELIHLARRPRNAELGFTVAGVDVDFPRVIARKDEVVADVVGRLTRSLESTEQLELVRGQARFVDRRTLAIDGECRLTAGAVILASGSRPARPTIPGAEETGYLTNASIMALAHLPRRLVVVGAGPVGMEFAQMFARFGSQVTVLFRSECVLPHGDPDIGKALTEYLAREGLEMVPHARVLRMERTGAHDGAAPRAVIADVNGEERRFAADEVLLAIGREPNAQALDLARAGITTTAEGWIEADPTLRTSVEGIFAVGDAIGHASGSELYTHVAVAEGGIAARNATGAAGERFDPTVIPGAVFTEPEVAHIGYTEAQARVAGLTPVVATYPFAKIGRARAMGEREGLIKVLTDADSGRVLGAHLFGPNAGELVHVVATAMATESRSPQPILDAIFIHPTLAEGVQSAFEELLSAMPARMAH